MTLSQKKSAGSTGRWLMALRVRRGEAGLSMLAAADRPLSASNREDLGIPPERDRQ
jgi:hypothetical protein